MTAPTSIDSLTALVADASGFGRSGGPRPYIILGFVIVGVVVLVSAAVLTRMQHAEKERRLDALIEADRARQAQAREDEE